MLKNFLEKKSGECASKQKKRQDRKAMEVGRIKPDSKMESNDSPKIPDRRETSAIPDLPLGPHYTSHGWYLTPCQHESLLIFNTLSTVVIVDIYHPVNTSHCWYVTPCQHESLWIFNTLSTRVIVDI